MINHLFPIEKEIFEAFNKKSKELYEKEVSDTEWTIAFKNILYSIGREHGYDVWGTGSENYGEWLWDVTWAKIGKNWMDFRGLVLVAEIEWSSGKEELLEDFLKLVVAKAEFRLFVFTVNKAADSEALFSFLMNACPGSEGSRYLAIAVPYYDEGKSLPYRTWTL